MQRLLLPALLSFCIVQLGCGSSDVQLDGDGSVIGDADPNAPDADPNAADADPNAPDADPNAPDGAPSTCIANGTQCNNCIDDDSDSLIDGQDPECTSLDDNDEGSFATGIPGPWYESPFLDPTGSGAGPYVFASGITNPQTDDLIDCRLSGVDSDEVRLNRSACCG